MLAALLLIAVPSCNNQPRPRYSADGLLLALPEGASPVVFQGLAADRVIEQGPLLVERVQLPLPVDVQFANGEVSSREAAWRISVSRTPGTFRSGALFWVIWVADEPLVAQESYDMSRITAVTFDTDLVTRGGQVGVSYGLQPDGREPVALLPPAE